MMAMADLSHAIADDDIELVRKEEAELQQCRMESTYYRLLRRVFIDQGNGNFELGAKLQEIMQDVEEPMTEPEFDACMERAARHIQI